MKRLQYVPSPGELKDYYGNPDIDGDFVCDVEFIKAYLIIVKVPYPMRLSWDTAKSVNVVQVHRRIAAVVVDAFFEILQYQGYDFLRSNGYDIYGGSYNFRLMRGGESLSTHAYGCAIDMNPHIAPYRVKLANGQWEDRQPRFITDAFLKRGFTTFPWDKMHYQACQSEAGDAICDRKLIEQINREYGPYHV